MPTEHELRSERSLHLRSRKDTPYRGLPFSHLSGYEDTTGFKTLPRLHAHCVTRRGLHELLASLIRDEHLILMITFSLSFSASRKFN